MFLSSGIGDFISPRVISHLLNGYDPPILGVKCCLGCMGKYWFWDEWNMQKEFEHVLFFWMEGVSVLSLAGEQLEIVLLIRPGG